MEFVTLVSNLFGALVNIALGGSKRRRRRLTGQLKNLCPHIWNLKFVRTDDGNNAIAYDSLFSSPVGTDLYICEGCGSKFREKAVQVLETEFVASVPDDLEKAKPVLEEIQKRRERCQRIIARLNRLGGAHPSKE